MILPFLIALIAWLASRINRHQDHVIRYLCEENRILRAKLKGKRISLTDTERRRLAVLAHPINRKDLKELSTIATPDTLRRWYHRLVVHAPSRKPQGTSLGRPRVTVEIEQLVLRMATENPRWGYRRIQGALSNLGLHIHNTTVGNILRRNHIDPAPLRGRVGMRWSQFITLHWEVLEASGVFAAWLSPFVRLWTVVTLLGCILSARGSQLLGVMCHGTMRMRALVAQKGRDLWTVFLATPAVQDASDGGRRARVSGEALPLPRLVSLPIVSHPLQAGSMEQERSPPAARRLACILHGRYLRRERGASTHHLIAVSTVLIIACNSNAGLGKSRRRGSHTDCYQAAA